jgi:hypothetical protein
MRKALWPLLLFTLVVMAAMACSYGFRSVEVTNATTSPLYAAQATDCDKTPPSSSWTALEPGSRYRYLVFVSGDKVLGCVVIADAQKRVFFTTDNPKGGVLRVTGTRTEQVQRLTDGRSYSLSDIHWSGALVAALLIPLLIFSVPGLLITANFFYGVYVSKRIPVT